jgi:hypothetical protein
MIEARMPDGAVLRFPANTPDDVVDRAAREYLTQQQPPSRGERFATGAGDIARGAEQAGARAMERGRGGWLDNLLRSNPNIAATMDSALPQPTVAETDARVQQREQDYQARRAAGGDTGMDWWRIGGQTAATLPAAALMPAGTGLMGAATAGAVQGAAMGGLQPVTNPDEPFSDQKARQLLYGGAVGAAGGAAGHVVGRMLSPRVSPNVRALNDAGVEMTPGQMVGGAAQRVEDRASSLPFVGDAIRTAQRRGVESLNRATANRVLREIGEEVPDGMPVGRDMVQHVADRVSRAYDDAIANVQPFGPDQQFAQEMVQAASRFATPEKRQAFADFLQQNVASRIQNGQLTGETYKQIDSVLGDLARSARSTTNLADREVGQMAQEIQVALRGLAARTNPTAAPAIRAADAAHAASVRLHAASAGVGAREGVFSGPQLAAAVRSADPSLRHNAYARGNALLQDLSDPAAAVLPSTVPNSGTPERLMLATALSGNAASAAGLVSWPALAAGAVGAGAYTRPATQALQAILARDPSMAARLTGDALAQSGGALTAPLAAALLAPSPPRRPDQRR